MELNIEKAIGHIKHIKSVAIGSQQWIIAAYARDALRLLTGDEPLENLDMKTPYIRADLVDKLIGYTQHDEECAVYRPGKVVNHVVVSTNGCTCGLCAIIKEIKE